MRIILGVARAFGFGDWVDWVLLVAVAAFVVCIGYWCAVPWPW